MSSLMLHRLPDFLLVVLCGWLGAGLLVRAPDNRVTYSFAWFCAHMVLYGLTSIQAQLTESAEVALLLGRLQLAAAVLTPVAFLHLMLLLTSPAADGRPPPFAAALLGLCYATGMALSLYALFFWPLPDVPPSRLPWTRWGDLQFPVGPLRWATIAQQSVPLVVVIGVVERSRRLPPEAGLDRRDRRVLAIAAYLGIIGGLTAIVARKVGFSPAFSQSMMVLVMLVLIYTVLSHRTLLPSRLSRRSFLHSILVSLFTAFYVVLVLVLEWVIGEVLHINTPLVTALSIVGLAAALGPVGEWLRSQIDRRFYPREFDYRRLVQSFSDELFECGDLTHQLQSGLASICQALEVQTGLVAVATPDGLATRASYGQEDPHLPERFPLTALPVEPQNLMIPWEPWAPARLVIPLRRGEERVGVLALGPRHPDASTPTFNETEQALLTHLSTYLALTIDHAQARDDHQAALVTLTEQSQMLRLQQEQLAQQTTSAARRAAASAGIRVFALGPLRVERDGEAITRWGGDKAGTYQAEALFAFLFDRRGKGITKDEAAEIIWPDLEISKADSAFHRTLAALRRTLEPGLKRGNQSRMILYHHDRYWLDPDSIAWCDTEEFITTAEQGITLFHQQQPRESSAFLDRANQLYRGDYMDDCPFFGDSSYVEEQRGILRSRYIEVQLALGAIYEVHGRAGEAASAYHRALALSFDGCPVAAEGLSRLQENLSA